MYKSHPKPQNALKRAQELFAIENYEEALELLQEVVKGKRVSRVWQKDIHEPIMQLYLQACVRLKKSQLAKEGLYQYKALCQSVNIKSLEDVVRDYLKLAKEFTEEAKKKSHQTVLDIDDLDSINSPESVLMSAVSSEDTQDRTNRTVLMPWLRFLWESYRHCMEVFKNHNKLERLYHDIAREAFQFCQQYDRKTEFRRLCDNLRYHLGQVQKYQGVAVTIDLSSEETLEYHTKTRLLQLEAAIAMDLWLEAFKAIDDFHSLLAYYKKPPKPQTIVDYYQKFALVCFQSCNNLYHAAALLRVYVITRDYKKSFTQEELANLSNTVLLATLTIPIQPHEGWLIKYLDMMGQHTDNQRRLCAVLNLPAPPTRQQLLIDMEKYGVLQHASRCLVDLHKYLENSFEPLKIHDKVLGCIEGVKELNNKDLDKYVPLVEPVMVVRVLKQISEIYKLIKVERLQEIMHSIEAKNLRNLCLRAARNGDVQLSIDERGKCIVFGSGANMNESQSSGSSSSVQPMESEVMREMVNEVANVLEKSTQIVYPENYQQERNKLRECVSTLYLTYRQVDHERMLERPERIEKRLEDIERECRAREEELVREQQKRDEELRAEEEQRLAREASMREDQRKMEEIKRLGKMKMKEQLDGWKKQGVVTDIPDEELENMDPSKLMERRKEELMREQKERVEKLKKEEKKVDYWERALREVEIPLIQNWTQQQMQLRKQQWDLTEQTKIDLCREELEKRRTMRAKCIMMVDDKHVFVEKLHENRKQVLQERIAEWESQLAIEKERLLAARRAKRKAERRAQFYARQKREEERLAAEAEAEERRQKRELEDQLARKQEEEEMRMSEERRREREKSRIDDNIPSSVGVRGSDFSRLERQSDRHDDRYRPGDLRRGGGGSPMRSSGAYQPPSERERYKAPLRDNEGLRRVDDRDRFVRDDERRPRDTLRNPEDEFRRRPVDDRRPMRDERDDFRRGRGDEDSFRRVPPDDGFRRGPRDDIRRGGDDDFDRFRGADPPSRAPLRGADLGTDRAPRDRERDANRFGAINGRDDGDDFRRGGALRGGGEQEPRDRDRDRDIFGAGGGGGGGGRDRERDRERSREFGFSRGGDPQPDRFRGPDRGPPPGADSGRGSAAPSRPPEGGDYGGARFRRGEDVPPRSDEDGTAPIRPFRPREEKKQDRAHASDDGWTEVRKR